MQKPENAKPRKRNILGYLRSVSREVLMEDIGELIYAIRFALVPMYVLLWVALIAYNVQFAREIFDFLFIVNPAASWWHAITFRVNDSTHYLLWILSLIDITMIGNLVVMTTVGGYSTFVKEYDLKKLEGRPRWMNGLDSTTLKNKMGMSLIGVSAIHLLKTFMEIVERFDHLYEMSLKGEAVLIPSAVLAIGVTIQIIIHMVFIGTTLAFAKNGALMHGHHPKPSEPAAGEMAEEHAH